MLAVLLSVMVASPTPGFIIQEKTVNATYYIVDTHRRSKIDVQACERFIAETEERFGVRLPHFSYYRVRSAADVPGQRNFLADGVADPGTNTIYSVLPCHRHEIVHLALAMLGEPDQPFAEGVANMVGTPFDSVFLYAARKKVSWRKWRYDDLVRVFTNPPDNDPETVACAYAASESWVRSIVKKHRMGKMVEFFVKTSSTDTRTAFCEVFGESIDESFDRWLGIKSRRK